MLLTSGARSDRDFPDANIEADRVRPRLTAVTSADGVD